MANTNEYCFGMRICEAPEIAAYEMTNSRDIESINIEKQSLNTTIDKACKKIFEKSNDGKIVSVSIYSEKKWAQRSEYKKRFVSIFENNSECFTTIQGTACNYSFINEPEAVFYDAVSRIEYEPKLKDIVWIFYDNRCFPWEKRKNGFFGHHSHNLKLNSVVQDVRNIKKENPKKSPNVIIYCDKTMEKNFPRRNYPKCKIRNIEGISFANGALINARVRANDLQMKKFKTTKTQTFQYQH